METIVLYGAGELGIMAQQFFNFYEINTVRVDDNPENITDVFWEDYSIIKTSTIDIKDGANDYLVLVCISTVSYNVIRKKLENKGFTNIKSFFEIAEEINKKNNYLHPLTNGWTISPSKREYKRVQKTVCNFRDANSFNHYFNFIAWHESYKEIANFKNFPICCRDRYFIPEVLTVLHDHEVFVDIGAYDGRVSERFMEIVDNKFEEVYCFEPDINQYKKIVKKNLDVKVYQNIIGNKTGEIGFNENNSYLSKVNKKSKNKRYISKFDTLKSIKPTFIKYHVEGYEFEAIKGSIKTLKKYRPIVAITTYHNEEGLYKLPLYLIKHLKNYNFYWRNHNYMGQGAVMYCIPKERSQ